MISHIRYIHKVSPLYEFSWCATRWELQLKDFHTDYIQTASLQNDFSCFEQGMNSRRSYDIYTDSLQWSFSAVHYGICCGSKICSHSLNQRIFLVHVFSHVCLRCTMVKRLNTVTKSIDLSSVWVLVNWIKWILLGEVSKFIIFTEFLCISNHLMSVYHRIIM